MASLSASVLYQGTVAGAVEQALVLLSLLNAPMATSGLLYPSSRVPGKMWGDRTAGACCREPVVA
jgi:hypothetical protein